MGVATFTRVTVSRFVRNYFSEFTFFYISVNIVCCPIIATPLKRPINFRI